MRTRDPIPTSELTATRRRPRGGSPAGCTSQPLIGSPPKPGNVTSCTDTTRRPASTGSNCGFIGCSRASASVRAQNSGRPVRCAPVRTAPAPAGSSRSAPSGRPPYRGEVPTPEVGGDQQTIGAEGQVGWMAQYVGGRVAGNHLDRAVLTEPEDLARFIAADVEQPVGAEREPVRHGARKFGDQLPGAGGAGGQIDRDPPYARQE